MMQGITYATDDDLLHCKCGLCNHESRSDCINGRCYCCDLEDIFAILSRHEFEPQSHVATKERVSDLI
jgi:hypothetical protein